MVFREDILLGCEKVTRQWVRFVSFVVCYVRIGYLMLSFDNLCRVRLIYAMLG